ncbi:MAG TPA: thioredoxin family protein [Opitutaceae bacterium]|nr:thioredoxin family protein [Opitutaceae bacterium]
MVARFLLLLGLATALHAAPEYPKMGPDIYDPRADGNALVTAALGRARAEHKNVLLMFGANWCIWCHRLHATFETNLQVASLLHANYELVMIDVNRRHGVARNADLDARYGNPTRFGLPVLVVLDSAGKQLTTKDSGELENGRDGHDPAKVAAFLEKWRPRA